MFLRKCQRKRYKAATSIADFAPLLQRLSRIREVTVYVIDAVEKSRATDSPNRFTFDFEISLSN
jgi:hypothetical protein